MATTDRGAGDPLWRSIKHEDIYLKGYASMGELAVGLTEYLTFYNGERPHQSLAYQTPDKVYQSGQGGGARIVDKFNEKNPGEGIEAESGQQRRAAACNVECRA